MSLSQDTLGILALVATALAVCALALAAALASSLARVKRAVRRRGVASDAALPGDARELALELTEIRDALARSVQHVGMIRFDAFEDMGGKLSFAAALLDAHGDGVVFSSINGRSETRIYAKPIEAGASRYNLSEEEEEAIRRALGVVRR